jgi:hypothetical protein
MGLLVNELYHIELQPRWGKTYDIQITGTISPDSLKEANTTVDIKKEFFDDYGIGISTYLLLITENTPIYIGRPIISYDPYEIDSSNVKQVYIPESLINFVRTYNYVLAKRYTFEVSAGVKRYKNILVEDQYYKDMRVKVAKALHTIEDLVADNLSTDITATEVLTTSTYLDTLDKDRQELLDKYKALSIQKQNNYEDEQRALYEQIIKTKRAETTYEEQKQHLLSQLNGISNIMAQNNEMNNILLRVKDIMREMIGKLKSGQMLPDDIPTFDNLYDEVAKELYGQP